jgi:competence protein ComEA
MWKKFLAAMLMAFAAAVAMAAVDVNKASEAELDSMKGIGPVTSKAIMAERKKGDFKSWDDFIKRVKGVGEKKASTLSAEGLTVNGEAYKTAAASKKDEKKSAKEEKKDAKAEAKAEKKEAKAEAKAEKKEAKAEAAATKKEARAEAGKPAASAAKK